MKIYYTKYKTLIQFIKFAVIGSLGTIISLSTLYIGTQLMGLLYWLVAPIGYLIGITNNFLLNRKFTFSTNKSDNMFKDYLKYVFSMGIGLIGYSSTLVILVEYFGIWYLLSAIFSTGISMIINFILSKYWVFSGGYVNVGINENIREEDFNEISVKIIISCLNEEKNLDSFLQDLISHINSKLKITLVLIDNGSIDNTWEVIMNYVNQINEKVTIKAIKRDKILPYGTSIREGLILDIKNINSYDYIGWAWSDNQITGFDVMQVIKQIQLIKPKFIKAMRLERDYSLVRKIQSTAFNMINSILFLSNLQDINGCPKFIRTEYLEKLDLKSNNWFLDSEIYIKMLKFVSQEDIVQIPVKFNKRVYGKSKTSWFTAFELLLNSLKFRFLELSKWKNAIE